MPQIAFDLIDTAEMEGWTGDLLAAVQDFGGIVTTWRLWRKSWELWARAVQVGTGSIVKKKRR